MRRTVCNWSISVLLIVAAAFAQTAAEWDSTRVNAIAQKLRCPCGCNLAMSCQMPPHPCPTCKRNRIRIYNMLAEGRTEQEILDRYVAEEGAGVLWITPGLVGKAGPYVVLAFGAAGVLLVIRRYLRAHTKEMAKFE